MPALLRQPTRSMTNMIRQRQNWLLVPLAVTIGVVTAQSVAKWLHKVTPQESLSRQLAVSPQERAAQSSPMAGSRATTDAQVWQPVAFNDDPNQTTLRVASIQGTDAAAGEAPAVRFADVAPPPKPATNARKAPPKPAAPPATAAAAPTGPTVRAANQPQPARPSVEAPLNEPSPAPTSPVVRVAQNPKLSDLSVLDSAAPPNDQRGDEPPAETMEPDDTFDVTASPPVAPPAAKLVLSPDGVAAPRKAVGAAETPAVKLAETANPTRELFGPPPLERPVGSVGANSSLSSAPRRRTPAGVADGSARRPQQISDPTIVKAPAAAAEPAGKNDQAPPAVEFCEDEPHLVVRSITDSLPEPAVNRAPPKPAPTRSVAARPVAQQPVRPRLVPSVSGPVASPAAPLAVAGQGSAAADPSRSGPTVQSEGIPEPAALAAIKPTAQSKSVPTAPRETSVATKSSSSKGGWARNLWPNTNRPSDPGALPSVDQSRTAKVAPAPAHTVAQAQPQPAPSQTAMQPNAGPPAPAPMLPKTLPLANMAPVRPPYLMVVAQRAQERITYGFSLAERGAVFSAETEFTEALLLVAQALDAAEQTESHGKAMAAGLRAFREAEDFVPRETGIVPDIMKVAASHQTPVLKQSAGRPMPVLVAMQEYYSYAQYQLTQAGGHEPSAAAALYGLARLQAVAGSSSGNDAKKMMGGPRAIALHQAALAIDPMNYSAANELGVLLARYGQWPEAQAAFLHSVCVSSQPESWRNLATAYETLGDRASAQNAWSRFDLARQEKQRGTGGKSGGGGDRPSVQMVDVQTFVQKSGGPEPGDMGPAANGAAQVTTVGAPMPQPQQQQQPQQTAQVAPPKVTTPEAQQQYPLDWLKSKFSRTAHQDEQPPVQRR